MRVRARRYKYFDQSYLKTLEKQGIIADAICVSENFLQDPAIVFHNCGKLFNRGGIGIEKFAKSSKLWKNKPKIHEKCSLKALAFYPESG